MIASLLSTIGSGTRPSSGQPLTMAAIWRWLTARGRKMLPSRDNRRLRLAETISLGDRRFVVLLEADGERFLVGSSTAGVSLLTRLSGSAPASEEAPGPGATTSSISEHEACCTAEDNLHERHGATSRPAIDSASSTGDLKSTTSMFCEVLARAEMAQTSAQPGTHWTPPQAAFGEAVKDASLGIKSRRHAFPVGVILAAVLAGNLLCASPARAAQAQARTSTAAASSGTVAQSDMRTAAGTAEKAFTKSANSGISLTGLGSSSAPWTIVVLLTVLTLIPSLMICMTPFARLLVVFHFLRQALGLQTTPSNQTLIGLSLILTFFIMQPLGKQIYTESIVPLQNGQITALEAVDRGSEPLRHFMAHYVREKDAALFLEIAHAPQPRTINDVSLRVLMPAYIVSELKAGFQIGAVLFLPFLVVDIVIASITTSVGMMQLPPVVISTPLKLMLFLMVDGWHLLIGALVRSFY